MVSLLLLGGNAGNRLKHLLGGAAAVTRLPRCRVLARSKIYETEPVGLRGRPFLNMALKIETGLSPMGLLIELKRLEALAGRKPGPRWSARALDIDIITYGRRRLKTRHLEIPHPLARRRAFAAAPLADIDPPWRGVLKRLKPAPGTVRIYNSG